MQDNILCPTCADKHKMRDEQEKRDLITRLKRIEGQVRGVISMLEADAYCPDVMLQVSAVRAALDSFNRVMLETHVKTCVADGIRAGDDSVIDELNELLKRITK